MAKNNLNDLNEVETVDVDQMKQTAAISQGKFQVQNIIKDVFGLEMAVESVPLPSRGIIYSPESPLYGQETL